MSAERLARWFEDLWKIIEEHNIEPCNLYNMDESGFAIGDVEASQRIYYQYYNLAKVSGKAQTSGMGNSSGMYLYGWKFTFSVNHIQV